MSIASVNLVQTLQTPSATGRRETAPIETANTQAERTKERTEPVEETRRQTPPPEPGKGTRVDKSA